MILNRIESRREILTSDEEYPYVVCNFVFQEIPKLDCSVIRIYKPNICQKWSYEKCTAFNGIGFHVCDF